MGRFGFNVIDADGHGGEFANWRDKVPATWQPRLAEYRDRVAKHYAKLVLPGGGTARKGDKFDLRPGMTDPAERLKDMDLEGIDVTVNFPGGAGEEWAMLDPDFAAALCRTMNDAKAEFCQHAPRRIKAIAKLPMIDPPAAAAELRRAVTELGLVGMVTPQQIREKNLSDPSFDVVWAEAERLNATVCVHGGGQAPDQYPIGVDRYTTRLEVHAMTHPIGNMLALMSLIIGGVIHRFPKLHVGFMESGCGWLPFWLERLDEHYELMSEQAPAIDRKPSEYFLSGRCFIGADPDEKGVAHVVQALGEGVVVYASDYCHWDCKFPDTVKLVEARTDISESAKRKILDDNGKRLYALA